MVNLTIHVLIEKFFGLVNIALGSLRGLGHHMSCISLPDLIYGLRTTFIGEVLVFVAIFFVKLSVTLFVLKIGTGLDRPIRIALIVNVIFLGLANTAFIIELLLQCRPIAGNWDPAVRATASCVSLEGNVATSYAAAGSSVWFEGVPV